MSDAITECARTLAAKYGNTNPWIPHNVFPATERERFLYRLRASAAGAGGRRWQPSGRCALRAINLPHLQPERRSALLEDCIGPLAAFGVDAAVCDGCDGRELSLDCKRLHHGGLQSVVRAGETYSVDTRLWRERWSQEDLQAIERRMAEMDWFPLAWLSYPKDLMERQTSGFVGGHISHVEVWHWASESGLDWVMVLEDDATPSRGFGLGWTDIWYIVNAQIAALLEAGVPWDILYVGRTPSYTPEGREVTPLIVEAGYCLRTHSYCLSRRGLKKLLSSQVASTITHRPQDEVLASLTLFAAGLRHPRPDFDAVLREMAPSEPWLALAFKGDGLTSQLEDLEDACFPPVADRAPSEPWLALAFKGDGLTSQLEDLEDSARSRSSTAERGSARAAGPLQQAELNGREGPAEVAAGTAWEAVD